MNIPEGALNTSGSELRPVLNSPDDITDRLLEDIADGALNSLTINYNLKYDVTPQKYSSPFFLAYHKKKFKAVKFRIYLGTEVTSIAGMFGGMPGLKKVPFFDTSRITDMSSMFRDSRSIESVPAYDTSKVVTMRSMFRNCRALTKIPEFKALRAYLWVKEPIKQHICTKSPKN